MAQLEQKWQVEIESMRQKHDEKRQKLLTKQEVEREALKNRGERARLQLDAKFDEKKRALALMYACIISELSCFR